MIEKIEWYREVLELEPNSKVFFPLARLLVDNREPGEAIKVLETGLERHPDFMEARLFLIELMHRAGMEEACASQISKLSKMFARYAGFWQAWAACLSSEPGEEDTASIIRFLAAHFLVGPLKISEALNLGLAEIIKKHQSKTDSVEFAVSPAAEETGSESPSLTGAAIDLGALSSPAASEKTGQTGGGLAGEIIENMEILRESSADAPSFEPSRTMEPAEAAESARAMPQAERNEPQAVKAELQEPLEAAVQEDSSAQPEELEAGLAELGIMETGQSETLKASAAELEEPAASLEKELSPLDLSGADVLQPEELELESQTEESETARQDGESFSLRTRSMAEVLADQGDYQGALDIYKDLAAAEKNAKELKNLKKRISELKKLKAVRPAQEKDAEELPMESAGESPEEAPANKKEKLLGILQALAKRVEARMNS